MRSKVPWVVVAMAVLVGTPAGSAAQMQSAQAVQVDDLRTMKQKFAGLADAIPQDKWDWRPMEGVRSVRDVLALMVGECNLFPTMWGYPAPAGASTDGFQAEMARVSAMSREETIAELNRSFDSMIAIVEGMDREKRMQESNFFGQTVQTQSAVAMATADMHEHLGQLIAYARMNRIVPPWSRGQGG